MGAWLAVSRFRGRGLVLSVINAALGVPSVVVGLVVYLLLSRSGPMGFMGLLFTPGAMIVAQTVLIAPMVAALSRQTLQDMLGRVPRPVRLLADRPLDDDGNAASGTAVSAS